MLILGEGGRVWQEPQWPEVSESKQVEEVAHKERLLVCSVFTWSVKKMCTQERAMGTLLYIGVLLK